MTEELLKRLDLLAAKLNVTVAHLWQVLVYQARVEAITDGVWLVLSLAVIYLIVRRCMKLFNSDEDCELWWLMGIPLFAAIVIVITTSVSLPTEIFNPEYFALKAITDVFKTK